MILSNKYLIHKTIKLFCIVLFIISYTSIIAQTPLIEWQKNFGGTEDEQIRSSIKTLDGGYIAVGYTKSSIGDLMNYGGSDVLIQKFNNNGELDFQKIFGSEGDDLGNDIQQSKDGGYVIVVLPLEIAIKISG